MSALTVGHDPEQGWDYLVRFWEKMEWPEGSKVEIIEGIVTVAPAPAYRHNVIAERIQRLLYSVILEDWEIFQTLAIAVPSRLGMLIPDLVVEVTSKSNACHDRVSKPDAYAAAGIPLYLLVDHWADGGPTVTLYGEPSNDVYRVLKAGKFGDPIDLPEPFNLTLDTSDFPHR